MYRNGFQLPHNYREAVSFNDSYMDASLLEVKVQAFRLLAE
jgi:hypothetical protein